jgi:hypothetical protein
MDSHRRLYQRNHECAGISALPNDTSGRLVIDLYLGYPVFLIQ